MKKNICIREEYTDRSGESRVNWNIIGTLIETEDGKQYVKLNHIPNTLCSVFEPKKKKQKEESIDLDAEQGSIDF